MRRYFRFSLRTLLILVLVAAIWLGLYVRSVQRQQASVAAVKRLGGWVYYDYEMAGLRANPQAKSWAPRWLLARVGEDYFHDVVHVNMVYSDDSGKRAENANLTGDALRRLDGFPHLQVLLLQRTQATDEGLRHVGRLKRLRRLYIWDGVEITDEGVRHLSGLRRLEYLHLSNSQITDESLAVLSGLPKLEGLCLQENRFSDRGLRHLQGMTQLKSLWVGLGENQITDDGLAALEGLANLEELDLQRSLVTERGLEHLLGLKNLKSLYLSDSRVTDVSALTQALPKCKVTN